MANLDYTTINTSATVFTFTKFSELPRELRPKTWAFALGPRILKVDLEWRRIHDDA